MEKLVCDHFELPKEKYVRDMDIMRHIRNTYVFALVKMRGCSVDEARVYVAKMLGRGGRFEFKDPVAKYTNRKNNGDREILEGGLLDYINQSVRNDEILVGTFTTYMSENTKPSKIGKFIGINIKLRSQAKHKMQQCEVLGDEEGATFYKNEQVNKKVFNNAMSGTHASPYNPLFNQTAHSTLTCNCRVTSGLGNANNEKFLEGNRHYHSYDVTMGNIIACSMYGNHDKINRVVETMGIRYPTVEETMACIRRSTDLYWTSEERMAKIRLMVENLSDVQRASFVYSGDFYHLRECNPEVIGTFLRRLSTKVKAPMPLEEANAYIKAADSDVLNLAVQICRQEAKGKILFPAPGKEDKLISPEGSAYIAHTIKNIYQVLDEYRPLFDAFLVTKILPASLAKFPSSLRRAVIMSDTDSTIFTVESWVKWSTGKADFDDISQSIAASMIFLSAKTIVHILAQMSINVGVKRDRYKQIAMKNEFKFDVFVPMLVAKHYCAIMDYKEGSLFDEHKMEIKGVHLKSSNAPADVMERAELMMKDFMLSVYNGRPIDIRKYLQFTADIEHEMYDSFKRGELEYFKTLQVKPPESYKKGLEATPIKAHDFWNATFGTKYGEAPAFPYYSFKASTTLTSRTDVADYLEEMEDKTLAKKIGDYMKSIGKHDMPTINVPESAIATGMPLEVMEALNGKGIVADATNVFYMLLASIGYHQRTKISKTNKKRGVLISDYTAKSYEDGGVAVLETEYA